MTSQQATGTSDGGPRPSGAGDGGWARLSVDRERSSEPQGSPRIPPGLAGILGFVAPGLGHLLLRMWSRAAIWLAGWVLVVAAAQASHSLPVLLLMLISGLDAYFCARERGQDDREHEVRVG